LKESYLNAKNEDFRIFRSKLKETSARSFHRLWSPFVFAADYDSRAKNTDLWIVIAPFIYKERQWNYGCWGQINDDEVQSGLGEPLDEIGNAFKVGKRCEECRNADFGISIADDTMEFMVRMFYFRLFEVQALRIRF
jgi:hypothetical protein